MREVRNEFLSIVREKDSDDKELWYTKAKFDEELHRALGDEYFAPWELRHDYLAYSDGVRSVEIANALHKAQREVEEKRRQAARLEASKRALRAKFGGDAE